MAYTVTNFKTKKALKEAVGFWLMSEEKKKRDSSYHDDQIFPVRCYQPGIGLGPDLSSFTGKIYLEGPHGFHRWYAEAWLENGIVVKVKQKFYSKLLALFEQSNKNQIAFG